MGNVTHLKDLSELLKSNVKDQREWLEAAFLKVANHAREEVSLHLKHKAYDEPLGGYCEFDQSRFDDMVKYPEAYDLGWDLQSRIPEMTDKRAEAINKGAELSDAELEVTRSLVDESQDQSEDGIYCSGFTFNFSDNATCFAAFTGPMNGPGSIEYDFYRLFKDKNEAERHFTKLGNRWWSF